MSQHRDLRVIAAALLLAWGFYTHYKNKRLSKADPDAELQRIHPRPSLIKDRPNDPKTKRFDTLVFITIVAIIVVISIANSEGCR